MALLAAALALPIAGCARFVSKLPVVISMVTDGTMVLDTIEAFVHKFFEAHPSPEKQQKIGAAIAQARIALHAALRTAHGAEKLNQSKVDEAFADFRDAYRALIELVGPLGIQSGDRLAVTPGGLMVPEPLALKPVK